MNIENLTLNKIASMSIWKPVPRYERLDIGYMFTLSLSGMRSYLNRRKYNNQKYKEFWTHIDEHTLNEDKTYYLVSYVPGDYIQNVQEEL